MASIRDGENELSLLGSKTTQYSQDYAPEVLEAFTNKHQGNDYWVRFHCPEFTSLCPITAQPDYADLIELMDPRYIEVVGDFTPRGGISILPFANYGRPGTKYEELAFQRLANHPVR